MIKKLSELLDLIKNKELLGLQTITDLIHDNSGCSGIYQITSSGHQLILINDEDLKTIYSQLKTIYGRKPKANTRGKTAI